MHQIAWMRKGTPTRCHHTMDEHEGENSHSVRNGGNGKDWMRGDAGKDNCPPVTFNDLEVEENRSDGTRRALGHALKPTYDGRAIKVQAPGSLGFRGKGGSAVVTPFRSQRWSRGQALNLESERRPIASSCQSKLMWLHDTDNKGRIFVTDHEGMKILLSTGQFFIVTFYDRLSTLTKLQSCNWY